MAGRAGADDRVWTPGGHGALDFACGRKGAGADLPELSLQYACIAPALDGEWRVVVRIPKNETFFYKKLPQVVDNGF